MLEVKLPKHLAALAGGALELADVVFFSSSDDELLPEADTFPHLDEATSHKAYQICQFRSEPQQTRLTKPFQ